MYFTVRFALSSSGRSNNFLAANWQLFSHTLRYTNLEHPLQFVCVLVTTGLLQFGNHRGLRVVAGRDLLH